MAPTILMVAHLERDDTLHQYLLPGIWVTPCHTRARTGTLLLTSEDDIAIGGHAQGDTITSFENVIGSAYGDELTGSDDTDGDLDYRHERQEQDMGSSPARMRLMVAQALTS